MRRWGSVKKNLPQNDNFCPRRSDWCCLPAFPGGTAWGHFRRTPHAGTRKLAHHLFPEPIDRNHPTDYHPRFVPRLCSTRPSRITRFSVSWAAGAWELSTRPRIRNLAAAWHSNSFQRLRIGTNRHGSDSCAKREFPRQQRKSKSWRT